MLADLRKAKPLSYHGPMMVITAALFWLLALGLDLRTGPTWLSSLYVAAFSACMTAFAMSVQRRYNKALVDEVDFLRAEVVALQERLSRLERKN